jgi:NAD(P)-dependent dehydrogenase (short-subunit alcohol dehydrogenase family)
MDLLPPKELLNFTDKVVIVTGAGSGIGSGIATRFAEAGAKVAVNFRKNEGGAQAVVESIEINEGHAIAIQADVTQREDVEGMISQTIDVFNGLDVLVNNAGVYPLASVLEMSDTEWDLVIDSNLRSVHLCTQITAKHMINTGQGGAIINIASIEAENPAPAHSHYIAAKGGVVMYTRAAANELGPHGIRVNTVSPGLIWREGLDQSWPDGVSRYRKAVPLGRLGLPEDIADACLFLASPAARWITGTNLVVDGGVMTSTVY